MANNRIGRGFSTISLAMSADKTVRVLDLSNNSITDEDATRLASFVANNESLVELNMERNWLGDSVAPLIVGALCRNTTLKTLNLNKNSFTNEAMKAFAIAIKFNSTMTHLHLAYARGVDAQGAQYVVSALEDNYTLVELELRYVKGPANAVARTMRQAVALLFRNKDITDRKHPTCFNEDKDPTTVSTFKTLHLVSPGLELDSTSFTNLETLVMTFVVLDFYDAVLRGNQVVFTGIWV
jgi:Ran GTPase-activating protein (RanGAP) involved in mRNA processing and transport